MKKKSKRFNKVKHLKSLSRAAGKAPPTKVKPSKRKKDYDFIVCDLSEFD